MRTAQVIRIGIAAFFVVVPAPAGAVLPEDGSRACEQLRSTLVYIGEAGVIPLSTLPGKDRPRPRNAVDGQGGVRQIA